MKAFDDTTATNTSLLLSWAYAVVRPIVRVLRAAGLTEAQITGCVAEAVRQHTADQTRGHLGSGTRRDTLTALAEITALWARSPDWTDSAGRPRELSLRPGDPKGFAALVHTAEPRLSATEALAQLRRHEVVRLAPNAQSVRLVTHVLLQPMGSGFAVEATLKDLRRFAETLEHNIFARAAGQPGRMQRMASRMALNPARFQDFERFVMRNGQIFLESADDILGTYVAREGRGGAGFGVGLFVYQDD